MRSFLSLLLALLLLAALTACGPKGPGPSEPTAPVPSLPTAVTESGPQASSKAVPPEETEPSPELTEAPPEETEAPPEETEAPLSREEAEALYQASPLDYAPLDREAETPSAPIPEARYRQDPDGIWRNAASPEPGEAVLMLTGDLMCQTKQQLAGKTGTGYDFRSSFDYVRPIFTEADLVIGNLEATLSESAPYMAEQDTVEGRPHLNAPAVFLEAVRDAGFDLVTTANNHNCDAGVRGLYDTLDRVEEYGLIHTGTFRGGNEPRFSVVEVRGIRVGFLAYATYFNHKDEHFTEEGRRLLLNPYDPEIAARDLAQARAAGAEFLIVCIHWGREYTNEPSEAQYRMAQELADAGADCIIGSHPHALQPYDVLTAADGREVPVVYSMGNFVSHQYRVVSKDTLILRLVLRRDDTGAVVPAEQGYIPCRVFETFMGRDYVVVPVVRPYNQGLKSRYFHPAWERITGVLGPKIPALGEE